MCYNMSISKDMPGLSDYDNPNWAYKQADRLGYLRAIKDIVNIITLDKEH